MILDQESRRTNHERLLLMAAALAPYDTGGQYLNFAERRTDPARFYTPGRLPAPARAQSHDRPARRDQSQPPDPARLVRNRPSG
jgi:hypothetical protein